MFKFLEQSMKSNAFVIPRGKQKQHGLREKLHFFKKLLSNLSSYIDKKMLLNGKILHIKCSKDQIANILDFLSNIEKNGLIISILNLIKVNGLLMILSKWLLWWFLLEGNGLISPENLTACVQNIQSRIISKSYLGRSSVSDSRFKMIIFKQIKIFLTNL